MDYCECTNSRFLCSSGSLPKPPNYQEGNERKTVVLAMQILQIVVAEKAEKALRTFFFPSRAQAVTPMFRLPRAHCC